MKNVAIYLRKSREDEKLEKELGKGETLSFHRRDLLKFAKENNFNVVKIFEELVSGESLLYRPQMLDCLKEVEQGLYYGILCMDQQRLGRGDMEEQGIILKTFKKTGTKIITPNKTYDLDDEFDEEYSEFEAFMSRKEYKMIKKRLQRGIKRSVEDGNYNSPRRPFGYEIVELKNGRTLSINENEANIVKTIYNWYLYEHVGSQIIADRLNGIGIKTTLGNQWSSHAVAELIKNPLYAGKIATNRRYGYRTSTKKKSAKNRPVDEWVMFEGKHEALISDELYNSAMNIMKTHRKSPINPSLEFVNPLSGLVVCGVCGSKLTYRTYSKSGVQPHLMCRNKCGNKSSKFIHIENTILNELRLKLQLLKAESLNKPENNNKAEDKKYEEINTYEQQLTEVNKQRENAYDLLEKGIYTVEVFTERLKVLGDRIETLNQSISILKKEISNLNNKQTVDMEINAIQDVLTLYDKATTTQKNMLLKSVIEKAVYNKEKTAREDNFTIELYSMF
ncbi:MAG: Recombinase [Eubacterium sp.]|nr:Recombinase [Eubacterium sp.]